jgi:hypothetical protein
VTATSPSWDRTAIIRDNDSGYGAVIENTVDVGSLLLKALIGGALVVAFSLVGEAIKPRRLAGITLMGVPLPPMASCAPMSVRCSPRSAAS